MRIICAFLLVSFVLGDDPTVHVKNGILKGHIMSSFKGREFKAFTGVPFAKPPLGDLRFKDPEPAEDWEGVKDATAMDKACIQNRWLTPTGLEGSEDCLYLNVYVPKEANGSLPVMVYIHGGAFYLGTGAPVYTGPHLFMDRDVVLVTINYRLGPLGFLTTGDSVVTGNAGLKDQILALKWVKENIAVFGGDPDTVTIFGVSAGGASVHLLMHSPLSVGLFHAAIVQSGTGFCEWSLQRGNDGRQLSNKLATLLNCPSEDSKEMVECLRKKSAKEIIETRKDFMEWHDNPLVVFKPNLEVPHEGAFITEFPSETMDVPLIIGITRDEGCLLSAPLYLNEGRVAQMEKDFDGLAAMSMGYVESNISLVMPEIRSFYMGEKKLSQVERMNVTNLYSDGMMVHCTDEAVIARRQHSKQPTYYYLLAHQGDFTVSMMYGDKKKSFGICHGDDMQYILRKPIMPDYDKMSEKDAEVSDWFLTNWINLAKYKNPNGIDTSSSKFAKWEPVTTDKHEYIYIDGESGIRMKDSMFDKRIKFWRKIKLNQATRLYYKDLFTSAAPTSKHYNLAIIFCTTVSAILG